MNVYEKKYIGDIIKGNPYVGRGIVIGKTEDGKRAGVSYFIMGRSENSRNRVFTLRDGSIFTEPFDASKIEDPSLIIYRALGGYENKLVVTNGDQTDTVLDGLKAGEDFNKSLTKREFEPDSPNFTPRISGMLTFEDGGFSYEMSILKSADEVGSACSRYHYSYPALCGTGHFIHTYVSDGNPLPTFIGEPERVFIPNDIDEFTDNLWKNLNNDNKISLYVSFINLEDNSIEERLINIKE